MDETNFKMMLGLQGKKLLWTGFDPEQGRYILIFDDKTAIAVDAAVEPIADVDQYIESTLAEAGDMAKQVLKLETLFAAEDKTDAAATKVEDVTELMKEGYANADAGTSEE